MTALPREHLAILIGVLAVLAAVALLADLLSARRRRLALRLGRVCPRAAPATQGPNALMTGLSVFRPALDMAMAAFFARETDRQAMLRLMRLAGFGEDAALLKIAAAKALGAVAMGGFGWLLAGAIAGDGALLRIALIAGAAVAGAIAPEAALRAMAAARRDRLRAAVPDAIDLLVIAAHSGQSLDMALDRVSQEMDGFAPEIAVELQITVAELQALPDRTEALRNFADRTDLPETRALVMTLTQSVRYGSPFAEALRGLGADLRQAKLLRAEEQGARLPALLTLPLILFILPAVFIVVVGPAAVSMGRLFGN
jgi:tight adherence protein C